MNNKDKTSLEVLAKKIKFFRKRIGISQEELAYRSGFDRTYISMLERAKRNPSYLSLIKLCNGLEIKLNELVE